jgi:hypothetical protein
MTNEMVLKPEVGGDLIRVHRAVTRAIGVAQERGGAYLGTGYPDAGIQKGYLTYVQCLVRFLHGHHTTEDEAMFPSLRVKIPDAPYDALMAQHRAMLPVLDEIQAAIKDIAGSAPDRPSSALVEVLTRLGGLWQTHIQLEEANFGPDAIGAFLSVEERRRVGKIASDHGARHQSPITLMLPFFLYNMQPEDRAVMAQAMPPVVPLLLVLFKPWWKVMIPFLLPNA